MKPFVLSLLLLWSAPLLAQAPAESAPDFEGRLYRSVFGTEGSVLTEADLTRLPASVRSRLSVFLARREAFEARRGAAAPAQTGDASRMAIERAIVSLVDEPGIEDRAADFAGRVPVGGDWTRPDGPLAQAVFAEDELKKAPTDVLAGFLYVFIAQRQRAAFEAAARANDVEIMKAAARKYRTFVARARGVDDPIYGLMAADLDRLSYVHLESAVHPRDFNPDT